jgi:serine/threonine protein kinase/WD40 repeat protein
MDDRHIFLEALNQPTPEERAQYLDETCGDNAELRQRVELLLAAHEDAGSFLEKTPEELLATIGQEHEVDLDSWKEVLTPSDKEDSVGMLGEYEILELIGRGGMGVVLSARDPQLGRIVAVKMLAPELAANAVSVQRFLREATAAAAVSHDHVITIHAIDKQARPPLIVMERIAGQSLQDKIDREGPLDVKSILRIGMQTASGLAAAHKQGLIHRDIKPSNILLENGIERVKLTDFGLARAVDDIGMTRTGQVTGTPQYMSPEQAQGHAIDHRTDLFSLGCVLYAMCTGQAAFRADSAVAVMHRVVHESPKPIREINEDIPDWLCRIVEKLMAKDPDQRFASASEVEDLLGRHLAHLQQPDSVPQPEPVAQSATRRVEPIEDELVSASRTFLFVGLASLACFVWTFLALNHKYLQFVEQAFAAFIIAGGLMSLPVGLLAMNAFWDVPRRKRHWWALLAARAAVIPWNPFLLLALPWTLKVLSLLKRPEVKQTFEAGVNSQYATPAAFHRESVHSGSNVATGRTSSTRGKLLVSFLLLVIALSIYGGLVLFDHDFGVFGKEEFTPKGRLVVNAAYEEDVTIVIKGPGYSVTSYSSFDRQVPPGEYRIVALRSLKEGNSAYYAATHTVRQNQTTTVKLERELARPGIADFDAIEPFLAEGPEIATLHISVDDPGVRLRINGVAWDIAGKGEQIVPLKPGGYAFLGMKGSEKAFERAIALKTGEERSLRLESSWGSGADIAESNSTAEREPPATVRVWPNWKQSGELSSILDIDEKEDGTWMASGHRNGFLYLWDLYYQGQSRYGFRPKHEDSRIHDVEFSPNDQFIAWVESNGQLRLRKASKHQISTIDKFPQVDDTFRSLAWLPDNQLIVVGGRGKLYLWDINQQEQPIETVEVPGNALVLDIAYSPRTNEIATALSDGNVILWNTSQIRPMVSAILLHEDGKPAHAGAAHAVAFSPTENLLLSCGEDGYVRAWEPHSKDKPLWDQTYSNDKALLDIQISHDGERYLVAGADRQLHLFDIQTLKSLIDGSLLGTEVHDDEITSVCFSWSDDIFTTGSADGVVKIWHYSGPLKIDASEWKQLLSKAASIPLDEWNTLSGDIKGPNEAAVRGEPLSLVLLKLNPFEAAKENDKVRQDFWYLTETIPKPTEIGKAISISSEKGYVSFLQPEYITNVEAKEDGDSATGHAGFMVPKLYSGRVEFQAARQDGTWKITEFTLPNYGIILRPDEQGLWQREISTVPLNITIDQDGNLSIQSNRVEWADLDQTLRDRRKSMGDQRVLLKFHRDVPVKKVEEMIDLLKKYYHSEIRVSAD